MKIVHLVGTRPNFMKVAPTMSALERTGAVEQRLVHSGQHYDSDLSDAFLRDLDLPRPDHFLGVGSGSHAFQTAGAMLGMERVLQEEAPDALLVPGDVNSTMGAALAAVKLRVPVIHLEAGLRSGDRSMPEEHNRVIVDSIADLLLTHSRDGNVNLLREGIPAERIELVGNTMIDSLRRHEAAARRLDVARSDYGIEGHLLVTLHRPALVDRRERLGEVMATLEQIARDRPVVFPLHPRTASTLQAGGWQARRVLVTEPQSYARFLSLLASAFAVLTDSGGVQEEATALGIPCFTLRTTTERPITVTEGTNRVLGVGHGALDALVKGLDEPLPRHPCEPEGWDGHAAERVADAMLRRYAGGGDGARSSRSDPVVRGVGA